MNLSDILPAEVLPDGADRIQIDRVTSQKDRVDRKTLFFLLPSVKGDSARFLADCLGLRPAAVALDKETAIRESEIPIIPLPDVRRRFAEAMARFYCPTMSGIHFYGITGTNGKTTTAAMLAAILGQSGKTIGRIGTGEILLRGERLTDRYYSMTTPDPDLLYPTLGRMAKNGATDVVMEVSSHALTLGKIAPIRFRCALFTNLSEGHLDMHGDMESYYLAKKTLFAQSACAVVCIDDRYGRRLASELREEYPEKSLLTYGRGSGADVVLSGEDEQSGGFSIAARGKKTRGSCPMRGAHNRLNATGAVTAALCAGVDAEPALRAIADFRGVAGRYEVIESDVLIVIDYAHTPFAMDNILNSLYSDNISGQKLTVVFGCGGDRDRDKRPLCAAIAEKYADRIILTSDNPRTEDPEAIVRRGEARVSNGAEQEQQLVWNVCLLGCGRVLMVTFLTN